MGFEPIPLFSVGSSGLEPLLLRPILQTGCRIRTTFATLLYLVMVMLHRLLHVKQLRFYYANEANTILCSDSIRPMNQ